MTTLPPTAIKSSSAPIPSVPSISLLPFHIAHSGPAQISKYFVTRPRPSKRSLYESTPDPVKQEVTEGGGEPMPVPSEASFRGRLVVSTPLSLPDAYTGIVFSTTVPTARPSPSEQEEQEAERLAKKLKKEEQQSQKAIEAARALLGRRMSPRKKKPVSQASKQRFSIDSDDEEEAENSVSLYNPSSIVELVPEPPIEAAETSHDKASATLFPPPPLPSSLPLLSSLSSSSSLLSTPNTPVPGSQEPSQSSLSQSAESAEDITPLSRDIRLLVPEMQFKVIEIWNPDIELDEKVDLYWRGVEEWIEVAGKIHAY